MLNQYITCSLVAASLVCISAGCGKSDKVENVEKLKPTASLNSQAKVSLIEMEGEFAKVRSADGDEFYVPKARLQDRNTLDRSDEEYTHVLAAASDAYDEAPSAPPVPKRRSTKDIVIEQLNVNQLYLSEKSKKEVIAPARYMAPWDEELGERCFPALTCENPDCPGEGSGDRPYLFIVPFKPSGGGELICPACAEQYDSSTWTEAELSQYRKWVKPYRLPEQAARLEQLNAEVRESARQSRSRPERPTE